MRGLYVHIPFCVKKCSYCDFYSVPLQDGLIDLYIKALMIECRNYEGLSFDTLYLGGGTPSLLGPDNLVSLVSNLRQICNLSNLVEATIEVNPESTTEDLLEAARSVGINRISIGVQSLCQQELKSVGRIHDATQAKNAVLKACGLGFDSISADLIIGLPGQKWETLRASIQTLINQGINHLSLYCLSLEPDTPLSSSPPDDLPSEDAQAELFTMSKEYLENSSFCHYEISNFAIAGHECLHNLIYWRGDEYIGLGTAAASHLKGRRYKNRADLFAYLKTPDHSIDFVEDLKVEDKIAEETILRLRLLHEGINPNDLIKRYGHENVENMVSKLNSMAMVGDLLFGDSRYRLAPSRILTSNRIFVKVLLNEE